MSGPAGKKPAGKKNAAATPSLLRRVWHNLPLLAVMCLSAAVIGGITILPLRTWLEQRELLAQTEGELLEVEGEVAELDAQLRLLQTDEEIERLGRENFDLVYPGEESYRILPAPED